MPRESACHLVAKKGAGGLRAELLSWEAGKEERRRTEPLTHRICCFARITKDGQKCPGVERLSAPFSPQLPLCLALCSQEMQSQSSVCAVNTIKWKPLEMSKGKLDNMCFDAGIWSLKVKKDRESYQKPACALLWFALASCKWTFESSSLKSMCLAFLRHRQIFHILLD